MKPLAQQKCLPCEGIGAKLSSKDIKSNLRQVKGWKVHKGQLTKSYKFKNFKGALKFVNKISTIAEAEQHHPDLAFGWGYVSVALRTHALKGLSMNDFILAAKIDAAF